MAAGRIGGKLMRDIGSLVYGQEVEMGRSKTNKT